MKYSCNIIVIIFLYLQFYRSYSVFIPSNNLIASFRGLLLSHRSLSSLEHKNNTANLSSSSIKKFSSLFLPSAYASTSSTTKNSTTNKTNNDNNDNIHGLISLNEIQEAIVNALSLFDITQDQIKNLGWNLVHSTNTFSLYKRRDRNINVNGSYSSSISGSGFGSTSGSGPVIYLMLGTFDDVSPRTFLFSQINQAQRKIWDTTMKDMKCLSENNLDPSKDSEDFLYFKTGWPWPLKDRDYVLSRRCKLLPDKNAIVFVSRSTEALNTPKQNGVIRVDNYWCHSIIIARPHGSPIKSPTLSSSDPSLSMTSSNSNINSHDYSDGFLLSGGSIHMSDTKDKQNKHLFGLRIPSSITNRLDKAAESFHHLQHQAEDKFHINFQEMSKFKFQTPWNHRRDRRKHGKSSTQKSPLDTPGMAFCTIFCDDSKVPLPSAIIDLLSKHAEKLVPESIDRLHGVAKLVETSITVKALSSSRK